MSVPEMKENADGSKVWWLNWNRHRTDGPAVEESDGSKYWFLNDKQVTWLEVYFFNMRAGDIQTAEQILAMPKRKG